MKKKSRRPSGLRKTISSHNSLAHRTTWLRSDFIERHGVRSGQTLSLKMDKNVPGIDTIYFSEDKKNLYMQINLMESFLLIENIT